MRLSRPCYDKMHRCPGWAGGGIRYARKGRCEGGHLRDAKREHIYEGHFWRFRFNRCDTCDVLVLPYAVRWVDPSAWWVAVRLSRAWRAVRGDQ